jgi:hypothetical protein
VSIICTAEENANLELVEDYQEEQIRRTIAGLPYFSMTGRFPLFPRIFQRPDQSRYTIARLCKEVRALKSERYNFSFGKRVKQNE